MAELTTRLITRDDGVELLEINQALIEVVDGPDRGLELRTGKPFVRLGSGAECDLTLTDGTVSKQHLELRATPKGFEVRDLGSTNGTFHGDVQLQAANFRQSVELRLGETRIRIAPSDTTATIELSRRMAFGELVGQSDRMRETFALLEKISATDNAVLIEGESGTGKELAAQGIHSQSARAEQPFVVVDCGAIPSQLIESELFGHAKGAFTGATDVRIGAFEQADGGTIFFDEIGELPLEMQPRLLRFLERREFKRVGEVELRTADVRVVAATNRNLKQEVEAGRFREDLFYRISVTALELPALRERPDDVELLATHCLKQLGHSPDDVLRPYIVSLLKSYHWPGNVRELRNVVQRLTVVPDLALDPLREYPQREGTVETGLGELIDRPFHEARRTWQERFERSYLTEQMQRADGVVAQAARLSDLPRPTFHRMLTRHGLREK